MKKSDLRFTYPEELVAKEPKRPSRVLLFQDAPEEISWTDFLTRIPAGDVLVLNNTRVLKRRVFTPTGLEILFLNSADGQNWDVLFPAKKYALGSEIELPEGRRLTLLEKGRPQKVRTSDVLDEAYFSRVAELPLPPYIQQARGERHNVGNDQTWYQTAWAEKPGSFAAPTASLHFSKEDIQALKNRGVVVVELTLHVGLGTFLPVTTEDLNDHPMHEEYVEISLPVWQTILSARKQGKKIWALGTTVTRSLESAALERLGDNGKTLSGFTRLLIQPGFEFRVVDRLLTNFHQPESTLLALVAGFAGLAQVKLAYEWAIERKFRLFSYGDLSAWLKN